MKGILSRYAESVFETWGWVLIVSIGVNVIVQIYLNIFLSNDLHRFGIVLPFPPLKELLISSSTFAQGFLALLVASILKMIRLKKAEWVSDRPSRLATITSLGFMVNGVVGILFAIQLGTLQLPLDSGALYFYDLFVMVLQFFSLLMPFLYATSVFILYRRLAEWVTLESELA